VFGKISLLDQTVVSAQVCRALEMWGVISKFLCVEKKENTFVLALSIGFLSFNTVFHFRNSFPFLLTICKVSVISHHVQSF